MVVRRQQALLKNKSDCAAVHCAMLIELKAQRDAFIQNGFMVVTVCLLHNNVSGNYLFIFQLIALNCHFL